MDLELGLAAGRWPHSLRAEWKWVRFGLWDGNMPRYFTNCWIALVVEVALKWMLWGIRVSVGEVAPAGEREPNVEEDGGGGTSVRWSRLGPFHQYLWSRHLKRRLRPQKTDTRYGNGGSSLQRLGCSRSEDSPAVYQTK